MHLHRSHDSVALAHALADLVASNPLAWNQTEWVAVQGQGMERWLSMTLAERLGGVLGLEHLFPRSLVERVLGLTLGGRASGLAKWGDASLTWAVLSVLPDLLETPEFEPVRRYLGDDRSAAPTSSRRLALARELSSLVDRYANYRPEMIRAWIEGVDESRPTTGAMDAADRWQPLLVRALHARVGAPCHAEILDEAARVLRGPGIVAGLPARVSIFGVTTLPPMYLHLLDALSTKTEVHLFWLAPTPHYFADQRTARERARARMRGGATGAMGTMGATAAMGATPAELEHDDGHPLLGSLGRAARDFQSVVYGVCDAFDAEHDHFEPAPDPTTVLGRLKLDLYDLAPTGGSAERPSVPFPEGDRSFGVHACHGPMRQVEVLRDELLRAFVELPGLEPRDVVVLCPDVDSYAPLVRAIFADGDDPTTAGAHRRGFPAIPVRVADSAPRHEAAGIDALLAIVALAAGRFTAPEVVDVLLRPAVARRFGLDDVDPAWVLRLVRETGMRWGVDGTDRARFGQPEDESFTLRRGLARLLLGQAMRGGGARAYRDVLPYDDADDRAGVGNLVEALETLFAFAEAQRRPRPPGELVGFYESWLDRLVDLADDPAGERLVIRRAVGVEAALAASVAHEHALSLEAQRSLLEHALAIPGRATALLGGAVSVASLVPMRAIPFRVVCLLGLDEATFPRRATGRGFDLTERERKPGDRRIEDDDRAAMLEAILSAGERLVLVHQGRDAHSNEALPMAAPVAELLEAVVQAYAEPSTRDVVRARLVVEHALHPFGASELAAHDPRTFDTRLLAQATTLAAGRTGELTPWLDAPLPSLGKDEQGRVLVRLADLLRFFDDPVRTFVEKRAGIVLDPATEALAEREPYALDSLESAALARDILRMTRDGVPPERQRERLRVADRLPVGIAGELLVDELRTRVERLLAAAEPVLASPKLAPVAVDSTFERIDVMGEPTDVRLVGAIDERFADGVVRIHPGKERTKHGLRAYLERAVGQAACAIAEPVRLYALGEDGDVTATRFIDVPLAEPYLRAALATYLAGSRLPLPFTMIAADAFLDCERKLLDKGVAADEATRQALRSARDSLDSKGGRSAAECERLDLVRAFGSPLPRQLFADDLVLEGIVHFREVVDRVVRPFREASESSVSRTEEGR